MKPQILQQGAEAIISLENSKIRKHRIKKSYRIKDLDEKLRKTRTKSEAKIINKLKNIINVPNILETDDKENIIMEYIDGKKLSEYLENLDYKKISKIISQTIAKIHNQNIIHGDLTTSNMIYVESSNKKLNNKTEVLPDNISQHQNLNINNKKLTRNKRAGGAYEKANNKSASEASADSSKVYLIDFGLAFHSHRIEDKAVDLHLLKQALEAKHYKIAEECIKIILENYNAENHKEILERIKEIEKRGRYKGH